MENAIPSNQPNLTGSDPQENAGGNDPIQPTMSPEEEEAFKQNNWSAYQKLLAKKDKEAEAERERARRNEAELEELRKQQKQQKLQELDEAERLRVERDEALAENAKLRMSSFAQRELTKRGIKPTDPIYDIVVESPWSVPFIRRSLGESPSWADVVQVVEAKLPAYLDTLGSNKGETIDDAPLVPTSDQPPVNPSERKGDPERAQNPAPQKRVWSRREIAKMEIDVYKKHESEIKLAQKEGRIVD